MFLIVNSIPKAGTHLVMRALQLAGLEQYHGISINSQVVDFYKRRVLFLPTGEILTFGVPLADTTCGIISREEFIQRFSELGKLSNKFAGGHMLWSRFAANYLASLGVGMIVVLRDPRAIACSHIHWVLGERLGHPLFKRYSSQSMEDCFNDEFFGIPNTGIENYPVHLPMLPRFRNMVRWKRLPRVHFVSYESLVGARGHGDDAIQLRSMQALLSFAGVECDPARVIESLWGSSETFRTGTVDGWKAFASSISREANAQIRKMIEITEQL